MVMAIAICVAALIAPPHVTASLARGLWDGASPAILTDRDKALLATMLQRELFWARHMATTQPREGPLLQREAARRIIAANHAYFELVVEAKLRAFEDAAYRRLPKDHASIDNRHRLADDFALVAGRYPDIGTFVFRIERRSSPMAYDVLASVAEEHRSLSIAKQAR